MEFYIKIENGNIVGHPVSAENYKQCFPEHNINTVPEGYTEFRRYERPDIQIYEHCPLESVYDWDGDIVYDRWDVRPMTEQEKQERIKFAKDKWVESAGNILFPSWIFNEEICTYTPPVSMPETVLPPNQVYEWDEESVSWIIKTNDVTFAPEWPRQSPW